MTIRVLIATILLLTATSTAEAERHCSGRLLTQDVMMGTLSTVEQPYCLHRPIRHRIRPTFAQQQRGLQVQAGAR